MKVLVADDELVSRRKMDRLLQGLGYETRVAEGGAEAYRLWRNEQPRIVVTDWNMPGMSGLDLCRRIRSEATEDYTYVIFVTGNNDIEDVIVGMEAGADDYIRKPFNPGEVKVRVRAGERVINLQSKETVIFALASSSSATNTFMADRLLPPSMTVGRHNPPTAGIRFPGDREPSRLATGRWTWQSSPDPPQPGRDLPPSDWRPRP